MRQKKKNNNNNSREFFFLKKKRSTVEKIKLRAVKPRTMHMNQRDREGKKKKASQQKNNAYLKGGMARERHLSRVA